MDNQTSSRRLDDGASRRLDDGAVQQHPQSQPLRRSSRIKKPSRTYIESLETQPYFDANVVQLLGDFEAAQLDSIFTFATSKDSIAIGKKPADEGFIPEDWVQAMNCKEKEKWLAAAHRELHRHNVNGTWRMVDRKKRGRLRWVFTIMHDGTYKAQLGLSELGGSLGD
jgi:hypothetical protein